MRTIFILRNKFIIYLMISMSFVSILSANAISKLDQSIKESNSLLCVGLDPDVAKMPLEMLQSSTPLEENVYLFLKTVVDLTAPHVCAYKAQKAFFDQYDGGHAMLIKIVKYVHDTYPRIPIFVDCKIGDTENTMDAYINTLFNQIKADAVVVNPYMGDDVLVPFQNDPNKVAIVLVQTSNPNGAIIQECVLDSGEPLWKRIMWLTINRWNKNNNMMIVLSSNSNTKNYPQIRSQIPQSMPILLAGIGTQGGNPHVLKELLNEDRRGVFVNSSRGILYPYEPDSLNWRHKIIQSAIQLKNELNKIRQGEL